MVVENYHAHHIEGQWKFRGRGGEGRESKKTKRSIMLNLNFQWAGWRVQTKKPTVFREWSMDVGFSPEFKRWLSKMCHRVCQNKQCIRQRIIWLALWAGKIIKLSPALWLATQAGNMELSCPLRTTHCVPHEKFPWNHIMTSSNHRLGSAGLNALEELLFRCWQ